MVNYDNIYKALLLVFMVGLTVTLSRDVWAGVVVGSAMCLVWLVAALIGMNTPRHNH